MKKRSDGQKKSEKAYDQKRSNFPAIARIRLTEKKDQDLVEEVFEKTPGTKKEVVIFGLRLIKDRLDVDGDIELSEVKGD